MPPKTPEEIEVEDLKKQVWKQGFDIEQLKKDFPEYNAAMCQDIAEVKAEAKETRAMIIQTNSDVLLMPSRIIEAMRNEGKARKMELRDWLLVIAGIASVVSPFIIAVWLSSPKGVTP